MKFVITMTIILILIGCVLLYFAYNVVETIESEHFLTVWGGIICSLGIMFIPLSGLVIWIFKEKK
jgi:hypothetical protein